MFISSTDPHNVAAKIKEKAAGRKVILTVPEKTILDIPQLVEELNKLDVQFMGGIFPKIIYQNGLYDEGIVVNFVDRVATLFVTQNLREKDFTIPSAPLDREKDYCAFTMIDGLTGNISNYLSELYRVFGTNCLYLGGGAGSLTLEQKPCVFSNEGFFMNAAITIIYETSGSIGVQHGWEKIEGPIIATKTDKNIIQELNWRNALEVYKEIVKSDCGKELNEDNFFDIAKSYPFGIVKDNSECVVRDPIATNDKGELICVGEVFNNTMLDVLKGKEENLLESANKAAQLAVESFPNPTSAVIIDCISRTLFLEDHFQKELDNVVSLLKKENDQMFIGGALTLGEISSFNGYLELFNKTIVIGLFGRK
ncbi:FIST C domain-containing protein [Aquimarina amphilecti]|uniref:FIST C domain-containing protein n=1 Tax=Aquimarina amphilecti TaxID=1038014 RepID=A0A1H7S0T2_AQUAM|nr:FIST N-terminal domain-containing protein [Aquimarina amphilecti]SEL66201.1 FIST C domain-containing protein [Aquimarina amphilecti]